MSGKYILNNGTGELDIVPGQENKRTWLDKHEAKLGASLNKPLVQTPFFPDTVEGVNHFIKYAKMDAKTPQEKKKLDDLAITMKKSLLEDYRKEIQPFDQYDKSTYPSDPKQRGKLLEAGKLEKDLEPKNTKRNYWDIIYQSMTPIEKGQWNAEKRKQRLNGKTTEPLKTKNETESTDMTKEITKNINKEIEAIRQFNILNERPKKVDPPNLEIRKPEP